jgi:hypothetical protein
MKKAFFAKAIYAFTIFLFITFPAFAQTPPAWRQDRVIELRGSWYHIGKQISHYFPEDVYGGATLFSEAMGISADEAREYYNQVESMIPADIIEELVGMAEGLADYYSFTPDYAWDLILIWNFGFDIFTKHNLEPLDQAGACTAFCFNSEAGMFLGHNTDNYPSAKYPTAEDYGVVYNFIPATGEQRFLHFFAPGFAGVVLAINESGIGVTFNVGRPNKDYTFGLPVTYMIRKAMAKSRTLDEAVGYFQDFQEQGGRYAHQGANILIADFANKTMARLQITSGDMKITYGQQLKPGVTYVACTNHFDDDFSPLSETDKQSASNISSLSRYQRLMELLQQQTTYDLNACWSILTDHSNGLNGLPDNNTICRKQPFTATTITNIFTADKAYYTLGVPCDYLPYYGEPQEIDLKRIIRPSIIGVVRGLFFLPVAKAKVILEGISVDGIKHTICTRWNGRFAFNNLPAGNYNITIATQDKSDPTKFITRFSRQINYDGVHKKRVPCFLWDK